MSSCFHRTWVEIDLDAFTHNFQIIRSTISPGCKIMSVVKADAYGHDAPHVAAHLQALGSDWFAVSNLEEAIQLRKAHITRPILILGYTAPEYAALLSKYEITQALLSPAYGEKLQQAAHSLGVTLSCHIKLDTGMSRIGFFYQDPVADAQTLTAIQAVCAMPNLKAEGIFTHFAVSDEKAQGEAFTRKQFENFTHAIQQLEARGVTFSLHHCSNSGAIMDYPEMNLDMVRPGIILYGLDPSKKLAGQLEFRPAMQMKSTIAMIKTIPADTTVSYGRTFSTSAPSVVATVPIGYADGYPRLLSNQGTMLLHGQSAPIVGRVCMDQTVLDISHIPHAHEGDVVTLFGKDGDAFLPVSDLAALCSTINYEIVCNVAKRVPRVFLKNGIPVTIQDHLCTEEDLL